MASNYGYTVAYVQDVSKSVAFYAEAFGCDVRCVHESNRWGELESWQTTSAFAPMHQHETEKDKRSRFVLFMMTRMHAAYKRAIEKGEVGVREPEEKEWGQKVGYVRDIVFL